jgi:hypothetical protein
MDVYQSPLPRGLGVYSPLTVTNFHSRPWATRRTTRTSRSCRSNSAAKVVIRSCIWVPSLIYNSGGCSQPSAPPESLMALAPFLLYTFSLVLLSLAYYDDQQDVFGLLATMHNLTDPLNTCDQIAMAISNASQVFFPSKRVILAIFQSDE